MAASKKIPVLLIQPWGSSFAKLVPLLQADRAVHVIECASAFEAVPQIRTHGRCIVVCHVKNQDHLVKLVTMLKLSGEFVRGGLARVLVTSGFKAEAETGRDPVAERLKLHGVTEVMPEPTNERSLHFKIERLVKTMPAEVAPSQVDNETTIVFARPAPPPPRSASASAAKQEMRWDDPLELESDCWLVQGGGFRAVGERWTVRLRGPGPWSGRWVELGARPDGTRQWEWKPTDPRTIDLIREEGAWIFSGVRPPEWSEDQWWFTGILPELAFYYDGETYGAKFRVEPDRTLVLARDSIAALQATPVIEATRHRTVRASEDGPQDVDIPLPMAEDYGSGLGGDANDELPESAFGGLASSSAPEVIEAATLLEDNQAAEADVLEGPTYGRPSPRAAGHATSSERRYRATFFGAEGGVWEPVARADKDTRWFVFLPIELLDGAVTDPRALPAIWTIRGPRRPSLSLDKSEWVLYLHRMAGEGGEIFGVPEPHSQFEDLPEVVQTFLLRRSKFQLSEQTAVDALAEAETAAVSPVVEVVAEAESDSDSEPVPVFEGEEPIVEDRQPAVLPPKRRIPLERMDLSDDGRPEGADTPSAFAELMATRLGDESGESRIPSGTLEALKTLKIPELGVLAQPTRGQPVTGPYAVRATRPPGPTLHPLALAFLASELASATDMSLRQVSETYCSYLSNSCGGLRVELWFETGSLWLCGATHDGSEGKMEPSIVAAAASTKGKPPAGTNVALIVARDGRRYGAIVVSGEKADQLARDYVDKAARMALGMAMSWVAQHAGKAPRAA